MNKTDKDLEEAYNELVKNISRSTAVIGTETPTEQRTRIRRLEAPGNQEEWIKYYFPDYAFCEPADFHRASTQRIIEALRGMNAVGSGKFYQSRVWARGLSKSTRRMMEVFYIAYTMKFPVNELLLSKTETNAQLLLAPYMANFEGNQLLIHDYGEQRNLGSWTLKKFITRSGWSFRAVGAEQNPRGSKNEALRINIIDADDLDDDEVCRNIDRLDDQWEWLEKAVIPTVEISKPYFIFFDNNIIAEDCLAIRAREKANDKEIVNIRDESGRSTWPQKNTEAMIDAMLENICSASAEGEYFNNPMANGATFPSIKWGKCPPLSTAKFAVVYADPSTSNKDKPTGKGADNNSRKAIVILAKVIDTYYIYKCYLDTMGQAKFAEYFYAARDFMHQVTATAPRLAYYMIENNTLQDPFYQQVLMPLIYEHGKTNPRGQLSITPDRQEKPDKWLRIEATLEPLNRLGKLIFNEAEQNDPHMQRLAAEFKAAKASSKRMDGIDAVQGAVVIIDSKITPSTDILVKNRGKSKKRY